MTPGSEYDVSSMTWHQWHQTAESERRTGLSSVFASANASSPHWRQWGDEAFAEAKTEDKPVLLSLSAVWCHWCHVMDETSYSDPGVISYLNQHFVPVRVDNDQRPDINARYNLGGWPTTAFLTPDGELMTGGTYIPPEAMLEHLPKIVTQYKTNREEIARKVEEMRQRRAEAAAGGRRGDLSTAVFDDVLRAVVQSYDPVFGGFGEAPKFPHADSIDLLLYAYRRPPMADDPDLLHMARKTLEFMAAGAVFDHESGGFFRYATQRDWSEPHYEKMLEDNAALLRSLLALYRTSGDPAHATAATRVIEYLNAKLRDRERGFFFRYHDDAPHVQGLLGDQAHTARALLDAHEVTGDSTHLDRAEALARLILDRFGDRQDGSPPAGFFDVWDGGDSLGRLAERQKSIQDNAVCAELLTRLHHLARSDEYAAAARATLEAFAPSHPALGYF